MCMCVLPSSAGLASWSVEANVRCPSDHSNHMVMYSNDAKCIYNFTLLMCYVLARIGTVSRWRAVKVDRWPSADPSEASYLHFHCIDPIIIIFTYTSVYTYNEYRIQWRYFCVRFDFVITRCDCKWCKGEHWFCDNVHFSVVHAMWFVTHYDDLISSLALCTRCFVSLALLFCSTKYGEF